MLRSNLEKKFFLVNEIPLSPGSFDILRILRVLLQLFSQIPNMHHDGVISGVKVGFLPDAFKKILGGKHFFSVAQHQCQDFIFDVGEIDLFLPNLDRLFICIHPNIAAGQFIFLLLRFSFIDIITPQE